MIRAVLALALGAHLAACASGPEIPKETRVPIPVPCEIEQVPATELPTAEPDANMARLAAIAAAIIELLKAENERLRAANNNPCPTEIPNGND